MLLNENAVLFIRWAFSFVLIKTALLIKMFCVFFIFPINKEKNSNLMFNLVSFTLQCRKRTESLDYNKNIIKE